MGDEADGDDKVINEALWVWEQKIISEIDGYKGSVFSPSSKRVRRV